MNNTETNNLTTYSCKLRKLLCNNSLWLFLYFIGMSVFFIVMPKYGDDQWYMWKMGDWLIDRDVMYTTDGVNPFIHGLPWQSIKETINQHYNYDNARLGNMAVCFFMALPKWVGSGLCALCWIYTVIIGLKVSGIDWKNSKLAGVAVFFWYFFMTWESHMGGLVFQFNYVLPGALSMGLLMMLWCHRRADKWNSVIGIFLLSLILGAWHEGFSIPFLSGLAVLMIAFKEKRDIRFFAALAGLTIGIWFLVSAPSFERRAGALDFYYMTGIFSMIKRLGKIIVIYHPSLLIFTLVEIVYLLKYGWKELVSNRLLVFVTISVWAAIGLSWVSTGSERSGWWSDLFVPIGIVSLLVRLKEPVNKIIKRCLYYVFVVSTVLSLALTDFYVFILSRECRKVVGECMASGNFQIGNDILSRLDMPLMLLTKVDRCTTGYQFLIPPSSNNKKEFIHEDDILHIIPKDLMDVSVNSGNRVDGSGRVRNLNGNLFVLSTDIDSIGNSGAKGLFFAEYLDFGLVRKEGVELYLTPFISEADGREYMYIKIYGRSIEQLLGEIKSIGHISTSRVTSSSI